MSKPLLSLVDLTKSFGGLQVCADICLTVLPGEIHALIGPNGAGKTTLLNLITGLLPVSRGTILFNGIEITRLSVPQRARLGMARSFQITSLFPEFTVQENIALAVQATYGTSYRFWQRVSASRSLQKKACDIMARVGLEARAAVTASRLAHGEQRLLEIGMVLAMTPKLLLLDEPMAGLGPESSRSFAELIRDIKGEVTILLVEHDMEAVFSLADRITVLDQGQLVATGSPSQIRQNPVVQDVYLGTACLI